ncbi:MAG: hypothetical protein ABSE16_11215 [Verrucomicrobiota bacterium]|jgi:hypothetical protein
MKLVATFFAFPLLLLCGCVSDHATAGHGDVGQFILQQSVSYGGSPTTTNGLPAITSHWRYSKDAHGVEIFMPRSKYPSVESFLNQAFAGKMQYGPIVAADGGRTHEYRLSSKGGGIQLNGDDTGTVVIILRPFSQKEFGDAFIKAMQDDRFWKGLTNQ